MATIKSKTGLGKIMSIKAKMPMLNAEKKATNTQLRCLASSPEK
ncbi:hypothetical protein [Dysgonomonas sp. 216]|nr:hypothetical protein [Dysgonomonas sp. 216]